MAFTSAPHWKVLHVIDADRLGDAAANAFLKALEEPPPRTVWLLDIADPEELPDTILSRCRQLRLATLSLATLEERALALGLTDEADRSLAVRAARGSPTRLARLAAWEPPATGKNRPDPLRGIDRVRRHRDVLGRLRDEGQGAALLAWHELKAEVDGRVRLVKADADDELSELAAAHGDELPAALERELKERAARREREARLEVLQGALDDLLAWVRDLLLVGAGGDTGDVVNVDAVDRLRVEAAGYATADLLWAADRIVRTREDLERNVAAQLAIEALLLELAARTLASR